MVLTTETDPNDLLYHYTDVGGLLGILQHSQLWATDAEYLNDTNELRYGAELLVGELRWHIGIDEGMGVESWKLDGLRAIADNLEHFKNGNLLERPEEVATYITCFTTVGDSLGQWRGYGSNGDGYAIGFSKEALGQLNLQSNLDRTLTASPTPEAVLYGHAASRELLESTVNRLAAEPLSSHAQTAGYERAWQLVRTCARIKDEAFADEQEWRLIFQSQGRVKIDYRLGGPAGVLPFSRVDLPENAIKQVVVGPSSRSSNLQQRTVERLLRHFGHEAEVIQSNVPYRA